MTAWIFIEVGDAVVRLDRIESWHEYEGDIERQGWGAAAVREIVHDEPGGVEVVTFSGRRYVDRNWNVKGFSQRVADALKDDA